MIDPNENILPYISMNKNTENQILLYGENGQVETKYFENSNYWISNPFNRRFSINNTVFYSNLFIDKKIYLFDPNETSS